MTAIREPGKINENTWLIDIGMYGVAGASSVYLIDIEDGKKCLIDVGSPAEVSRLIKALNDLNAFPPDIIILTHSHSDHVQSVPILRKKAEKKNKKIEVMASQRAIPQLEDQSWNEIVFPGPFESIKDVTPLKDGEIVDLNGLTLKTYDVHGHSKDDIAILDEKNKNIFLGDAIGDKVHDTVFLPPFMPPFWNPDAWLQSMKKLKEIKFNSVSVAHFGYIYGDEAMNIIDEAISNYKAWWDLYERNEGKLDDIDFMVQAIFDELIPTVVEFKVLSFKVKLQLTLLSTFRKITRKDPLPLGEILLQEMHKMLANGYKIYKESK